MSLTIVPQAEAALADLTDEQLVARIGELVLDISHTIIQIGELWREAQRRGIDLTELRSRGGQLVTYAAMVASGNLIPEAVMRFAGNVTHLRLLSTLPPNRQRLLVAGDERIPTALPGNDEQRSALGDLRADKLNIVFDFTRGVFRSVAEQRLLLTTPRQTRARAVEFRSVKVEGRTVRIGKAAAPADEVITALRAAGLLPPK